MEDLFDQERRELAAEYNQQSDRYEIYKLGLKVLFWLLFFSFSVGETVYQNLAEPMGIFDFKLIIFIVSVYLLYSVVMGAADYQLSYKLSREYNLSNQQPSDWLKDKLKMFVLTSLLLYIMARGFLLCINWLPGFWWLPFTVGGVILATILNFLFPVVLFPLFFEVNPYPENELRERLMNLFDRANIEVDDIYQFNLSSKVNAANAAVMGMGQTRKIILGDNLEDKYTNAEIEAVLAHEIGHHAHKDIFKLLGLQFVSLLATTFLVSLLWVPAVELVGYAPASVVSLPVFLILFGVINWLISPVELYINRHLERAADEFALDLIAEPRNLGTAFAKLADESLSRLQFSLYKLLFKASHPPIGERVEKALSWREEN